MLTKFLQKSASDLLKVCQIGEVQTAQQLAFFHRMFVRGRQPALLSAEDIKQGNILYGHVFSSFACLPGKAQANSHFVFEQLLQHKQGSTLIYYFRYSTVSTAHWAGAVGS